MCKGRDRRLLGRGRFPTEQGTASLELSNSLKLLRHHLKVVPDPVGEADPLPASPYLIPGFIDEVDASRPRGFGEVDPTLVESGCGPLRLH